MGKKRSGRKVRTRQPAGLGPPGFNALFLGVVIALVAGLAAGDRAGGSTLLKSNLVFRTVVGGVAFGIVYCVVAALWFAWHRRTFQKLGAGTASAEAPANQATETEVAARDEDITDFMDTTTGAIEELDRRLRDLEDD